SPNPPIYTFIRLHGGSVSSMSITEHFKKFFFRTRTTFRPWICCCLRTC
ncbi:hypothetical protein EE612_042938, partial [Oryza sativa]